jgi:hypothetical protein
MYTKDKCLKIILEQFQTLFRLSATLNLYEPCVLYIGRAHNYPPKTPFYICFQQIYVLNFLNMLHTLRFFSLQNAV